ncbi:MAG: ornithine racemase [Legionella sp.]|nr:MAG: ornithine racemase [Legionella sp.]PJE00053.1 MAG: ornithine racemase [Legionella sp.]
MRRLLSLLGVLLLCTSSMLQAESLDKLEHDLSDSFITTKIAAQFAEHHNVNLLKIKITTHEGVVTLSGYVKDKDAYVDALRTAHNTKGVKRVNTEKLYIKKINSSVTDALITARVETAVLKAKVLDDESIPLVGINAKTIDGIVTLSGQVQQTQSIGFIIKRVNAIKGVKKIISYLKVKEEA